MIKLLYYSNKIERIIGINKIKNIININDNLISLLYHLNRFKDIYVSKSLYYLMFYCFVFWNKTEVSLNALIMLSIMGAVNNTFLFKYNEVKKIMLDNYQVNSKFIIGKYYHDLLVYLLQTILYVILFVILSDLNTIYILYISLFLINIKSIFASFFLYLYQRYGFIYNEDDPSPKLYMFCGCITLLLFASIIFHVDLSVIIHITNVIGLLSHIYIIKFKDTQKLVNETNYSSLDFNIGEVTKVKYKEVKDEKISYKYLNNIFNKRYKNVIILYTIKGIVVGILVIFIMDKTRIINNVISLLYFTNINNNMIKLYHHKCDKFLKKYISPLMYNERRKTMNTYNLLITIVLSLIISIKYNVFYIIPLSIILAFLYTNVYLFIYYTLKPFDTTKRTIVYHVSNFIISIIMLLLDYIHINTIICVFVVLILNLIINLVKRKYICKVQ